MAKYAVQLGQRELAAVDAVLRTVAWGAAALLAGATFGPAGRKARRGGAWSLLFLAAALELEATAFLFGGLDRLSAELRYDGQPAAIAVFVGELVVALACALEARARFADARSRATIGSGAPWI